MHSNQAPSMFRLPYVKDETRNFFFEDD